MSIIRKKKKLKKSQTQNTTSYSFNGGGGKSFLLNNIITKKDLIQPREERDYKEFFPDLNIYNKLIINRNTIDDSSSTITDLKQPLKQTEFCQTKRKCLDDYLQELKIKGESDIVVDNSRLQVEYDMDVQDYRFIRSVFEDVSISSKESFFEFVFDRIEKEWFISANSETLKKSNRRSRKSSHKGTPIPDYNLFKQSCDLCDSDECSNTNAIVFCDRCNIALHQECYGIPYIPEGQWLCRECLMLNENNIQLDCLLCPNKEGAYKQTMELKWVHLQCAIYIPELSIENVALMEPIIGIENIPKARWKLKCYLCKQKKGCCIQCNYKACKVAFHVTCAKIAGFKMEKSHSVIDGFYNCKAYCYKHTKTHADPKATVSYLELIKMQKELRSRFDKRRKKSPKVSSFGNLKSGNSMDIQEKYIVSNALYNKVLCETEKNFKDSQYINKATLESFVKTVCRYWTLKKRSSKGAHFIKKLKHNDNHKIAEVQKTCSQREEWKVQAKTQNTTPEHKALLQTRKNLEKARVLIDLVKKREKTMLKLIQIHKQINMLFFNAKFKREESIYYYRIIFLSVKQMHLEYSHLFNTRTDGSLEAMRNTQCSLETIEANINKNKYTSFESIKKDLYLVYVSLILDPGSKMRSLKKETNDFIRGITKIIRIVEEM